eukprot:TRINITY_DN4267_c0_g1_i1.p1 TRINITY_DN4267_c0_g1~~TRINITY_DN4267_c0_g1_i1.p1  ORF type:complete len:140 (+),score=17.76 TRINITY_DN4267_c0_g1_i1:129-548(+)
MCVDTQKILTNGNSTALKSGITPIVYRISKSQKIGHLVPMNIAQKSGPLGVNNGNEMKNPLYRAFINAGVEAGYFETKDYNGEQQEGFGPVHMTVKNGVRSSTANAYLRPAMARNNLTVITHALVHKVLLDGKKAVGVR